MYWMVFRRLLNSPCRTDDLDKAELFFVPTWSHGAVRVDRRGKRIPLAAAARPNVCVDEGVLLATLQTANPRLQHDAPLFANSRRHLKVDPHGGVACEYWSRLEPQTLGHMARSNFEIRNPHNPTPWYVWGSIVRQGKQTKSN